MALLNSLYEMGSGALGGRGRLAPQSLSPVGLALWPPPVATEARTLTGSFVVLGLGSLGVTLPPNPGRGSTRGTGHPFLLLPIS